MYFMLSFLEGGKVFEIHEAYGNFRAAFENINNISSCVLKYLYILLYFYWCIYFFQKFIIYVVQSYVSDFNTWFLDHFYLLHLQSTQFFSVYFCSTYTLVNIDYLNVQIVGIRCFPSRYLYTLIDLSIDETWDYNVSVLCW